MATPTTPVKELPKEMLIGDRLKGELLAGDLKLKPTDSTEKNVLPTAEDMKQEKNHQGILTGIEGFTSNSLKPTETKEKVVLPGKEEIKAEKTIQGMLQGVEGFAKDSLKDVRTREPASPTAILQTELARDSSLKTVSEFDKSNLKKAETMEKNPLPSSEAIAQELEHLKFKAGIEGYDQSSLSHATTVEKNTLPTQVSPLTDASTLYLDRICFAFERSIWICCSFCNSNLKPSLPRKSLLWRRASRLPTRVAPQQC